jgi:7-carboxy-7-deazaguanine synthase
MFESVQGEGLHTGIPATFIRFAGCNLSCSFCDTKHSWKEATCDLSINEIFKFIRKKAKFIVLTGGEPFMQPELPLLVEELLSCGYRVEIETNGTLWNLPKEVYSNQSLFVSMSPKKQFRECVSEKVTSLKVLYPFLPAVSAEDFIYGFSDCKYFSLQPLWVESQLERVLNINAAMREAKRLGFPWRVGTQLHKYLNWR